MSTITSLLQTSFSKSVVTGNPVTKAYIPSTYTVTDSERQKVTHVPFKSCGVTGIPDINKKELYKLVKEQESNALFNEAWKKLVSLLAGGTKGHPQSKDLAAFSKKHKEFFYLAIKMTFFSLLGRKNLSFRFRNSGNTSREGIIEVNATYDEPSDDFPRVDGNPVAVFINRKTTNIIFNKATGVVVKSEITGTSYLGVYVWECGPLDQFDYEPQTVVTYTAKISTTNSTSDSPIAASAPIWFTHSHSYTYYRPGNYKALQQLVDTKNKTVTQIKFAKEKVVEEEPSTPAKKQVAKPQCPPAPVKKTPAVVQQNVPEDFSLEEVFVIVE